MDFTKLQEEFQKDGAALGMLHDPKYSSFFFWHRVKPDLEKLDTKDERLRYLNIIATAKGALSIKERDSVLQDIDEAYDGYDNLDGHKQGFLLKNEYLILKDTFLRSQEEQFQKNPQEKRDSVVHRALEKDAKKKGFQRSWNAFKQLLQRKM